MEHTITRHLLAVGYETDFSGVCDALERYYAGIAQEMRAPIRSGVLYALGCRGQTAESIASDSTLNQWFERRAGRAGVGRLRRLHVSQKRDLLVGEVQFGGERIYVFLLNRDDKSTSLQKKLVARADPMFTTVDVKPAIEVPCRAYRHVQERVDEHRGADGRWRAETVHRNVIQYTRAD